jgi:hypothetical protein
MKKNAGILVEYTDKNGKTQKGIARHKDQVKAFSDHNKILVWLLNDDLTEALDETGKKLVALKHVTELKQIGFSD